MHIFTFQEIQKIDISTDDVAQLFLAKQQQVPLQVIIVVSIQTTEDN